MMFENQLLSPSFLRTLPHYPAHGHRTRPSHVFNTSTTMLFLRIVMILKFIGKVSLHFSKRNQVAVIKLVTDFILFLADSNMMISLSNKKIPPLLAGFLQYRE